MTPGISPRHGVLDETNERGNRVFNQDAQIAI